MNDYTLRTDKETIKLHKQPVLPRKGDRLLLKDTLYMVDGVTHEITPEGTNSTVSAYSIPNQITR